MSTLEHANELYEEGYEAFRAGDNERCKTLTSESLAIGHKLGDDDVVGQALTGLCRCALRDKDEKHLKSLSTELAELAERTGNDRWRMVVAHMNAEMARMNGELERAEQLYDESMRLSELIGRESMVAAECFNKSFIAVAQKRFETARELLQRHFAIREKLDEGGLDPYGLIAVANLLVAEGEVDAAAEVAFTCRRLLAEEDIIPDPADEEPLRAAEDYVSEALAPDVLVKIRNRSAGVTCRELVAKYIS